MIYILGISAYYHDSAAALIGDGKIIAAAQEERFTRIKGDSGFPYQSIKYCLESASISINQISNIVFYDKPILKFDRILSSYIHTAPLGLRSFLKAIPIWLKEKLWAEDNIKKALDYTGSILFTEHHQAHAASAFYASPFANAAILTVDGAGEWATTTIGIGKDNSISLLKSIEFPHSLGLLYSAFTYYCGFRVNSGEYKLMGLAPYGKPIYLELIKNHLVNTNSNGSYRLNEKYFNYISGLKMINRKFETLFGQPALEFDKTPTQFYMDIAASIQEFTNEEMVKLALYAKKITGADNLTIAGGVGLNCVANSRIRQEAGFKNVWIQPAAGDSGGALGAALYSWYSYLNKERITTDSDFQLGSLLGPSFSNEEVQTALSSAKAVFKKLEDAVLYEKVATALSNNKVVGWFQGRMEFGPRALGNRSILGDARSPEMQSIMNIKIKFRESFRPFAPSILSEKAHEYFDFPYDSPYMLFTAKVTDSKLVPSPDLISLSPLDRIKIPRSVIPAVTHLDLSARLQTVDKKTNLRFHSLISEFYKQTGFPILINTSFNVRGEPIVCTPLDAYRCFMNSNIDLLVIENFLLLREDQPIEGINVWKQPLKKD